MAASPTSSKFILQQPDLQVDEVQPIILKLTAREIGDSNISDLPLSELTLHDSEKRWLVVGICVNKIINPLLRKHVESRLMTLYSTLKSVQQIDNQSYSNHLKKFPPKSRSILCYENINNNIAFKRNPAAFNYNVTSHVHFAKLFLLPHLAKFSAFDETCDASALLGLICNIQGKVFDADLRKEAEIFRSNIRNSWAHCNFTDWDELKYLDSFKVMYTLIKLLNLSQKEEEKTRSELTDWETKGFKICFGSNVDVKIMAQLQEETKALTKYILKTESLQQKETASIAGHLEKIEKRVEKFQLSVQNSVQRDEFAEVRRGLNDLAIDQERLNNEISQISNEQDHRTKITENKLANLNERVNEVYRRHDKLCEEVKDFSSGSNKKLYGEAETFMSPSRVQHFTGRTFELQQLKSKLASDNEHRVMSICGLGGCGKTSLAIEFSWLFRSCYPGGVFWVSAENNDSFTNSVNQFTREIGISGKNFSETYELSLKWLATLSSRWLLVIDNMDQYEVPDNVKKLLQEHWRRTCKGHLLVTTRRSVIEMTEIYSGALKTEDCLQMNCLSIDESVSFMSRRTQKEIFEEQEAVTNLATELGGLPLALEQAAAYIKRLDCPFREYLEQFRIQRLKLLKKRVTSSSTMSKERLTVTTTWSMNFEYINEMSEEEGYGKSAAIIMEVSAFFAADDIPLQAINVGFPAVKDKDLEETLELPLGSKQILEILTRFSLFQSFGRETYSVHRLVQEVIRGRLDKESVGERLEIGIRMLHKAIKDTVNPTDLLYRVSGSGMANDLSRLHLWGKLAHQVCVLIEHIEQFVRDGSASASDFINLEVATIFHEASVFHSVNKRHVKALDLQNKKNKILAAVHGVDDSQVNELTMIKIPLNDKDQTKLQNAMKGDDLNVGGKTGGPNKNSNQKSDDLRERGNSAFKGGKLHEAIKWYTNAICVNDSDSRLYNNRSLCHFKLNNFEDALTDADESIKLDRNKYKAFARRAFALNGLAEQSSPGMEKTFFESSGHAAASIAAFLHPPCNLEYDMKMGYPILVFKEIRNDSQLLETLTSKFTQPNTTLLLHPGEYRYCQIGYQDVRIVGIHTGVTLNCTSAYVPVPLPAEAEPFICHFENLTFKGMSFLVHLQGKTCSFYNCKFANGEPACDNFPKCDGFYGCRQPNVCSQQQAESPSDCYNRFYKKKPIGRCGYPGLEVSQNSTVFLHRCVFERCGGGGLLVDGIGSKAYVQHCVFRRNRQQGLEVRNQGKMYVEHCDIEMNQTHGVAIGPEAEYCYLNDNKIIGNYEEGVYLHQSCGIIVNNFIGQNYACGISVDHLNKVAIRGNRIFDNWHWGILIQGISSAFVQANEIFRNKCGGILISCNASARAVIDANTIRGHTGPALYTKSFCVSHKLDKIEMQDGLEIELNSSPPIITDRNTLMHNDMGKQHPKEQSKSLFQVCAHCYGRPAGQNKLLRCSACKQAYYCSDKCSESHWVRHKDFCHILQGCNFITVKIPSVENKHIVRIINPGLAKIGHTAPPKRGDTFIVKIQGGPDYMTYNPNVPVGLYDRSMTIDFFFVHPEIYHIVMECGVLCTSMFSCKKIFCWATYTDKGESIRIQTDVLAPFQKW